MQAYKRRNIKKKLKSQFNTYKGQVDLKRIQTGLKYQKIHYYIQYMITSQYRNIFKNKKKIKLYKMKIMNIALRDLCKVLKLKVMIMMIKLIKQD